MWEQSYEKNVWAKWKDIKNQARENRQMINFIINNILHIILEWLDQDNIQGQWVRCNLEFKILCVQKLKEISTSNS